MTLIIDGYNLLHASGILGHGIGPGGLERSRLALLNFLAESLEEAELARTTVVFDAREAPPGLPRQVRHRGINVLFASPDGDADAVIEDLIRADTSPRKLTVVSSDHRLHRAARRRRATAVDSDQWHMQVVRARAARFRQSGSTAKRGEPASEDEIRFWLEQFGMTEPPSLGQASSPPSPGSPFPPGYAEDLGEDEK